MENTLTETYYHIRMAIKEPSIEVTYQAFSDEAELRQKYPEIKKFIQETLGELITDIWIERRVSVVTITRLEETP